MIRTLIKKIGNRFMSTEIKDKKEEVWYVWTKSERAGDVVRPLEEQKDPKWLNFTDGTKINKTLVSEFLMVARSEAEAGRYSQDLGGFGTKTDKAETAQVKPAQQERRITDGRSAPEPEVNVMTEMLKKISKKNVASMPVNVNIPAKEVYDMLQDQMDLDSDELNQQIGALVESQIDNLREQLKEQIETFITNYYKNEPRKQTR